MKAYQNFDVDAPMLPLLFILYNNLINYIGDNNYASSHDMQHILLFCKSCVEQWNALSIYQIKSIKYIFFWKIMEKKLHTFNQETKSVKFKFN